MSSSKKCVIRGCKSDSLKQLGLQFFRFPTNTKLYNIWLEICYGSAHLVQGRKTPYICSRHFRNKDVGFRDLVSNARPSLYLNNPPRHCIKRRRKLKPLEETNLRKLLNATVIEWFRRARQISPMLVSPLNIIAVAQKVHKILGPGIRPMVFDMKWCKWFQQVHLLNVDGNGPKTSLNLQHIIKELDPKVQLFMEKEIELSGKKTEDIQSSPNKNELITALEVPIEDSPREDLNKIRDCTVGHPNANSKNDIKKRKTSDSDKSLVSETSIQINNSIDPNERITISEPLLENKSEIKCEYRFTKSDSELAKKAIKVKVMDSVINIKNTAAGKNVKCESRHYEIGIGIKTEPRDDLNHSKDVSDNHLEIKAGIIDVDNSDDEFPERLTKDKPPNFRCYTNRKYKPKDEKHFVVKLNDNKQHSDLLLRIEPEVSDTNQINLSIISQSHNDSLLENNDKEFPNELNNVDVINFDESHSRDSNTRINGVSPRPEKEDTIDLDSICSDDCCSTGKSTSIVQRSSQINSYEEALEYLEPLEHFVLWTEDYRAIELVSKLETNFKNKKQVLTTNKNVNK